MCYSPKRLRCDFRFSCDLQGHFACTLQHSVADRIVKLNVWVHPNESFAQNVNRTEKKERKQLSE